MTIFFISDRRLDGTIAVTAMNQLNSVGPSFAVAPYDLDDLPVSAGFWGHIELRLSEKPGAISYVENADLAGEGMSSGTGVVFTSPAAVDAQTVFDHNLVGNQIRTIIHEVLHLSGSLDSRRDQIASEIRTTGVPVNDTMLIAIEELLVRQATRQIDLATDSFRAYHHRATIGDLLSDRFYADGIQLLRNDDGTITERQVRDPLTLEQREALESFFVSSNYASPMVFVNGQYWMEGVATAGPMSPQAINEYNLTDSAIEPLAYGRNGGVALLQGTSGQVMWTEEGSRYTEPMLSFYGSSRTHSDGSVEAYTGIWATIRMIGDQIGFDGQFGIQGGFARPGEGLRAAEEQGGGSNNNESNDRKDRVIVVYGETADPNKTVIANGGTKVKPILLDLDGDGIEITELDRSTIFMDVSMPPYLARNLQDVALLIPCSRHRSGTGIPPAA